MPHERRSTPAFVVGGVNADFPKVIVARDWGTGDEAIYVDGVKVFESSTVRAYDIAEAASGSIKYSYVTVDLLGRDFPMCEPDLTRYVFDEA